MLHSSSTICSEQYAADWCVVRVDRSSRRGRCSEHRVTYVTSRGETTHKSSGGSRWVTPPLLRQRTTLSSQYSYIIHKCREKLQWPKSALLANWPSPRPCPRQSTLSSPSVCFIGFSFSTGRSFSLSSTLCCSV